MGTDLSKLRRFALATGVILFLYAIAGVRIVDSIIGVPLELSLEIDQPSIFEWALVIVSIYAALRYWYCAFIVVPSPSEVRRFIRKGEVFPMASPSQVREFVRRYLPGLDEGKAAYVIREHSPQQGWGTLTSARLDSRCACGQAPVPDQDLDRVRLSRLYRPSLGEWGSGPGILCIGVLGSGAG